MSSVEYFRARASAYRQVANASQDERVSGGMYEIACMFNRTADDLHTRQLVLVEELTRSYLFYMPRKRLGDWRKNETSSRTATKCKLMLLRLFGWERNNAKRSLARHNRRRTFRSYLEQFAATSTLAVSWFRQHLG